MTTMANPADRHYDHGTLVSATLAAVGIGVVNAVLVGDRVFVTVRTSAEAEHAVEVIEAAGWSVSVTDPDPVGYVLLTVSP